ncbi:MAG TPA: LysM peptidoglycan-binding domain-containing protein [Pseudomonas sp.]|jgi:nucleoid-associated protein YgaU|uniref:Peptidoglycan-binding protein n=1 Tax=Halopseudomonas pachastrellae TaxID=254161 RepID=A0A1S8DCQ9_9GAMM|nr:LysM peptidoglycan-binding domain-containing protein [Halopseudomonas pachastrellae]MAQ52947.1 LysM peptidoglycan-binding domain-containing protein [Pseudomonas sp.]MBB52615.1 LysM peptidoglycan-binding domain-containing protein [Pseudomonadales bacterium]MED5491225.1 LysM peptidoglycan-binding domain-containing protein [Pseudomonadota bacterium]MEE3159266.1 LysM peptidoglycan-binding domain-containing protein [Pseudomonadota bacterium]ONM43225.1 peptidoglycan-binding protein [Halopseudomon|tara:strand:- start:993 stop:2018 length:1026 start_codon:yes stop_codon:yes gene_type:complete
MRKTLLGLVLLAASVWVQAQEPVFKEDHPDTYTVVKGDTLWDISGRFLRLPWKWPEIWHANPQISNPHLIYPGDVISLVYIDGQPRLMVNRGNGGTIKLSPQARVKPIAEAIPTIPLEAINSFLRAGRIIEDEAIINNAPYVIGGEAESVVLGAGNKVYARGNFSDNVPAYEFYRRGKTYVNPETGELLGIHLQEIGNGNVAAVEGDIATLNVTRSRQEVLVDDRLLESEERAVASTFFPSEPSQQIDGLIMDVPNGVTQIGQYDVVLIDKGERDGLTVGNVLAIYKTGEVVRDRVMNERVQLPAERAGLLMVFRAYDKMSYGIVLQASRQMAILDQVRNP